MYNRIKYFKLLKVTLKKLDAMNPITEQNKHKLKNEKIDQVLVKKKYKLPSYT